MQKDLNYYTKKFAKLGVDRAHGVAPHKPTLLLSVIEQFEKGKIQHNQIYLTPELIATFLKYWSNLVTTDHRSDVSLPFFHLTGDKFWHLMPNPGFEATVASRIGLTHCTKWAYCESTHLGRFSLLQIPLPGLKSGREEQENQAQSAENHTRYFGFSVNA